MAEELEIDDALNVFSHGLRQGLGIKFKNL